MTNGVAEWPLPLLLDEVWLRSHRELVHGLEMSSLWPDSPTQQRYMAGQRQVGESLQERALRDVLGPVGLANLRSGSAFGVNGGRVRRRTPFVLAFGYGLGIGLHSLLGGRADLREPVGELCAIFNLGVSIVDTVVDASAQLAGLLTAELDERGMRDDVGAAAGSWNTGTGAETDEPEISIALKLIASFFHRLGEVRRMVDDPDATITDRLFESLALAYRSEISSAEPISRRPPEWIAISKAKSTLPFSIIADIARLGAGRDVAPPAAGYDELVENIETVFWVLDDIVDLVPDLQGGTLNSLLAARGRTPGDASAVEDHATLSSMLGSTAVEDAVRLVVGSLTAATKLIADMDPAADPSGQLPTLLLGYVRDWIE